MKYQTILLFGAPGSGKGTQGKILGTIPNFFHCACGDVFRSLSAANPLARVFIEYTSRGQLVPDEPTVKLWRQFIQNSERIGRFNPGNDVLVLDGIPRNLPQAEMLDTTLEVRAILYLHCANFDRLVQRLQRRALKENRLDDANLDVIRHRLKVYERETKPVLKYYGAKKIHRIDSTQPPTKVLRDILARIDRVMK
ncbi:MAG TPA: nucleoside monophosphate kinase [Verrucomicrobiota bacterium]|nr:nucleoside monophosphate kinase [Verrucomicrobiota bacterium]HNT13231.1 nucleoside monophosphate kinase [Verrucomicrobiota bacterium]